MKPSTAAILGAAAVCAALAACSNKVSIKAEQSGATAGSTGNMSPPLSRGRLAPPPARLHPDDVENGQSAPTCL